MQDNNRLEVTPCYSQIFVSMGMDDQGPGDVKPSRARSASQPISPREFPVGLTKARYDDLSVQVCDVLLAACIASPSA